MEYYCRIYNDSSNSLESFSEIRNSSCFSNQLSQNWEINQINSSLKIFAGSLNSNQTYQFMVQINNRQNSSLKNYGFLIVFIQNTLTHQISIR